MRYDFEWDPEKASKNLRKHKISFERAASIFRDLNLLTIPDEEHSAFEERWITMGLDGNAVLLVISHKFSDIDAEVSQIRIISARKATASEAEHYEKGI